MAEPKPSAHFGNVAGAYAAFRPRYPAALFDWLADVAPDRGLAWDSGAGSGQATGDLARRFGRVIATDASPAQLASSTRLPGVVAWAATAERSGIRTSAVDLVTVAQALHWFDLPAFYAEVRRVLRPGGVLAAWTYADPRMEPPAGPVLDAFAAEMRRWWPPARALVDSGYRTIDFPFVELPARGFEMEAEWPLDAVVGYIGTWSAVGAHRAASGDPLPAFRAALAAVWEDAALPRRVVWRLSLRAGHT